jgi:hypothetical protein
MALLARYDTPAFLPDFNAIPGQLEAWHDAVSHWFDGVIAADQERFGSTPLQYYNAVRVDPGGVAVEQAITWNAFPKEMVRRYGRERALILADRLWPLERYGDPSPEPDDPAGAAGVLYRPQEEYCEWHVLRDGDSGHIQRVTFTSEPPEYWQALAGLVPGGSGIADQHFPGSKQALVELYQELVNPRVRVDDLFAKTDIKVGEDTIVPQGQYNIYNKWNTTHGVAHLNAPPNSLLAEIQLGCDATVRYTDPKGRLLVEPEALITYGGYGGANRNSDPTIGAAVNALARLGAMITLRNPVGLYIDHVDLAGWESPDGQGVSDCVRIVRGLPGLAERIVVEVPSSRGFTVSDLRIAGEPIRYGGQIAECITVKLVGVANVLPAPVHRPAFRTSEGAGIDPFNPRTIDGSIGPGRVEAFLDQGTGDAATPAELSRATRSAGKMRRSMEATHRRDRCRQARIHAPKGGN